MGEMEPSDLITIALAISGVLAFVAYHHSDIYIRWAGAVLICIALLVAWDIGHWGGFEQAILLLNWGGFEQAILLLRGAKLDLDKKVTAIEILYNWRSKAPGYSATLKWILIVLPLYTIGLIALPKIGMTADHRDRRRQ
jgi:hypothetical protein